MWIIFEHNNPDSTVYVKKFDQQRVYGLRVVFECILTDMMPPASELIGILKDHLGLGSVPFVDGIT